MTLMSGSSALLNPRGFPAQVLEALKRRQFIPVLSPLLIEELKEVLVRPRLCAFTIVSRDVAVKRADRQREPSLPHDHELAGFAHVLSPVEALHAHFTSSKGDNINKQIKGYVKAIAVVI